MAFQTGRKSRGASIASWFKFCFVIRASRLREDEDASACVRGNSPSASFALALNESVEKRAFEPEHLGKSLLGDPLEGVSKDVKGIASHCVIKARNCEE